MAKTKAHVQYRLADKTRVPGVTTITGQLGWNKQILVNWANRLGLEGINSAKFVDDKAAIGTIAHGLILQHHSGEKFDTSDYSKNQIASAENSLLSYLEWEKGKKIEPILLEKPLVSEKWRYGGTPDNYCKLDGVFTLLDYKSGKGIYDEHFIQVGGGYRQLLIDHDHPVDQVIILNVPRTEDESFQHVVVKKIGTCWRIFMWSLNIYYQKKELGKNA